MVEGRKNDISKPNLDVVFSGFNRALLEVGKVGTYGIDKYSKHNWLHVSDGQERYTSAMLRHYLESKKTQLDSESNLSHLAHMAWNALAALELELIDRSNNDNTTTVD